MPPKKLNGQSHGYIGQTEIKFKAKPKVYLPNEDLTQYRLARDRLFYERGQVSKGELGKLSYWTQIEIDKL
jgi:hypothetical protein